MSKKALIMRVENYETGRRKMLEDLEGKTKRFSIEKFFNSDEESKVAIIFTMRCSDSLDTIHSEIVNEIQEILLKMYKGNLGNIGWENLFDDIYRINENEEMIGIPIEDFLNNLMVEKLGIAQKENAETMEALKGLSNKPKNLESVDLNQ